MKTESDLKNSNHQVFKKNIILGFESLNTIFVSVAIATLKKGFSGSLIMKVSTTKQNEFAKETKLYKSFH